jgi:hypothetical protein
MRISNILLKRGAENGLTLYQIGKILCRSYEDETKLSILEKVVQKAERIYITHAKLKAEQ